MKPRRCPICRRGVLNESPWSVWCSRRHHLVNRAGNIVAPCDFEIGWCNSSEEFQEVVERFRENQATERRFAFFARASAERFWSAVGVKLGDEELFQALRRARL